MNTSEQKNDELGGWSIEHSLILFVHKILPPNKTILEFGSGAGTDALLATYRVISIEHDEKFAHQRENNHEIFHAPIRDGWYSGEIVRKALWKKHDLILIDGPPLQLRYGIMKNLNLFKRTSCPIIFDDMDRLTDRKVMEEFCDALNYSFEIRKGEHKSFAVCHKRSFWKRLLNN